MATEERVKRGGFTFKVFQLREGGPWYAGSEASKGATKAAAITAHMKVARADMREYNNKDAHHPTHQDGGFQAEGLTGWRGGGRVGQSTALKGAPHG